MVATNAKGIKKTTRSAKKQYIKTRKSTVSSATQPGIILVAGATGHQGGAVARALAGHGWQIRALVRDTSSRAAALLRSNRIKLVKGDLEDRATLDKALSGAYGVFGVFTWAEKGFEGEVRQAKNLADAAKAAGVKHMVYSSVAGIDQKTGVPGFDNKREIEAYLQSLGIPLTIFRPVFLMYNFNMADIQKSILEGTFSLPLRHDKKLQLLAAEDLGEFVHLAFKEPKKYVGKVMELAGDEMSMDEIAGVLGSAIRRPVSYKEQPIETVRLFSRDMALMYEWLNQHDGHVNIQALRARHPGLMTLETWLRKTNSWLKAA